ncbi:MAG: hypothetical protein JW804_04890 [Sedimentisphaerales bacterium]|nr:hypothetical protein [Sedimentisphaerales bacterium]
MKKTNQNNKLKICLVASAGGHMSQLLKLRKSWSNYETICVTTSDMVSKELSESQKIYAVGECNRENLLRVVVVFFRCLKIILRERPDVLISTGAAVGCICCWLAKFIGAKIIWIDSITNVDRLSLSGRLVHKIADLLLVQWPELAACYRKAEYLGTLI